MKATILLDNREELDQLVSSLNRVKLDPNFNKKFDQILIDMDRGKIKLIPVLVRKKAEENRKTNRRSFPNGYKKASYEAS